MTLVVRSASKAFIVPNPLLSADKYLHSAANVLCLNPIMAPAIEVGGGDLFLETDTPVLAAVAGEADVSADGRRASSWAAVRFARSLEVHAGKKAYVSIKGLRSEAEGRAPLHSGHSLALNSTELDGVEPRLLAALKVPPSLRGDGGDWLQAASRLQRYLQFLADIVQRGAELVRVNLGGVEYEAWVLEL
ncbi:MAG: hypothetical protein QW650_00535 [Thermofilum sp.]